MRLTALLSFLMTLLAGGCARTADPSEAGGGPAAPARNVILCIGDGMGVVSITAARVLHGERVGAQPPESADLFLDTMSNSALVRTYSADCRVTDSAAAMTAMVTGHKCCNYVVAMDAATDYKDRAGDGDGEPLRTILEIAESMGKATGIVTTTAVTHATPAACYAHINSRWQEQAIADQLLANPALGDGLEVILGGGRQYFLPLRGKDGERQFDEEGERGERRDQVDLRPRFRERGYTYVHDLAGFEAVEPSETDRLLGLFEADQMEYEVDRATDRAGEPSLAQMVRKAIAILSRDRDGFFLMIEGGRIDHALHEGQARRALVEVLAFDDAVRAAASLVDLDQTLIVVAGDHDHTMVIAGSPPLGSPAIAIGGTGRDDVPYTSLLFGTGPGFRSGDRTAPTLDDLASNDYRHEAAVPRRGGDHGGMDVAAFAIGLDPYASRIRGGIDNTEIFEIMLAALEGR